MHTVSTNTPKSSLPSDPETRKRIPIYSGVVAYFPLALAAVARRSWEGNEQHHPGTPLHWDRSKSGDELDALMRHLIEGDWEAVAWRALANLQKREEERMETEQHIAEWYVDVHGVRRQRDTPEGMTKEEFYKALDK